MDKKNRACLPFPGRQALFHEQSKKGWRTGISYARRRAPRIGLSDPVAWRIACAAARRLVPGSSPSCHHAGQRSSPSRIMPGDGESRTACATRDLASDPAKSFWQGWGSLRGKERPFQKGAPSSASLYCSSSASISASSWRMPSRRAAAVSLRPAWSSLPMMSSRVAASQGKRLSARASARVTEERPLRA